MNIPPKTKTSSMPECVAVACTRTAICLCCAVCCVCVRITAISASAQSANGLEFIYANSSEAGSRVLAIKIAVISKTHTQNDMKQKNKNNQPETAAIAPTCG